MFANPKTLAQKGVLGMNKRNIDFIGRYNPRSLYKLVDDKLMTKQLALKEGINTPGLIGVIRVQHEIEQLPKMIEGKKGFVVKPAQGSGGKGILVITHVEDGKFYKPSGDEVTPAEMDRHCSNVLSGLFTLGGKNDVAVVEDLIKFDPVFDGYSFEGVPDIRLIVFKGFPIMGMLRLSTRASDGKANLHQGAVGVGLDLVTGKGLHAVQYDRPIELHPDTGKKLIDIQVPHWDKLMETAAGCYEMSGLGYLGTDMVLDVEAGPQLLELNARPGLAIQTANARGILPRLQNIQKLGDIPMPVAQRIEYVKKHFHPDSGI
ncbi:alpha-L-glutamate ligase-like protein [Paraferrimonas haliotis]|uniref:alpha-L-glutamate ligase-like protein n=1 Tax=Paraferrimonas haliotis TaxID=2013866 RepID=UPI000BA9055E|nr:alpha-L-glutamate ligase-like protein [Paraferrimonas haliotis]